jgi:probable F420-dependent oxidoreductase
MGALSFGIAFANAGPFARPANAAALGALAEAHGFDSLWTVEHVVIPKGYTSTYPYHRSGRAPGAETSDIPDPLVWLAFVAARTTTIKLATGILILPQRNPVVTAKEVATLDVLSNGRAVLGVGSGWLEEEFDALGVPFADRGDRLDDHIRAMRALWHDQEATYEGRFSSFRGCIALPRPVQASVPIVVGGHTTRAARRAGELGDGFFPARGEVDELRALLEVLRRAAEASGRDPSSIELTTSARDRDTMLRLADLGFTRFVIPPPAYDHDGLRAGLERFEAEVMATL